MFIADYMDEFQCIGDQCEDSCCAGWTVNIDKSSYKKYQKVNAPQLKQLFNHSLKRVKGKQLSANNYATIKLDANNHCPLLDRKGLCQIHSQMGERALSKTCRTYPRFANSIDGMLEVSATLSCPEVARLALLNKNGIGFKESELDLDGLAGKHQVNTKTASAQSPNKYLWQLQLASIELLKDRRIPVWKRLLILGMICQAIDSEAGNLTSELVDKKVQMYLTLVTSEQSNIKLDNLETDPAITLGLIGKFIALRQEIGTKQPRFTECYELATNYLTDNQSEDADFRARYLDALENHYLPFMAEHEYILENYLVNYVFQSLFPAKPNDSLFENYLTLVVNYTSIRMYLVGMAGALKEDFSVNHALQLIQTFVKAVEHSSILLKAMRDYFKERGLDSMAMMSFMLKDHPDAQGRSVPEKEAVPAFVLPESEPA